MTAIRGFRRRGLVGLTAVAAMIGTCWGAGNSAAWQHHEGKPVSNVTLSSGGDFKFTLTNPTADTIRCTVNMYNPEVEPEIRTAVDRVNTLAAANPAPGDIDAQIELSNAIRDLSPKNGQLQYQGFGLSIPGKSSKSFGVRLDAPIRDSYAGYSYCDTFSTAPITDFDVSLVIATKSATGGGGAFGSLEQILP